MEKYYNIKTLWPREVCRFHVLKIISKSKIKTMDGVPIRGYQQRMHRKWQERGFFL